MQIRVKARGKINWTLSIQGIRKDGYHSLDMLMQSVELSDEMQFEEADELSLRIITSDGIYLPNDERNLVMRAASALASYTGCTKGASIQLVKHIPMEAGMGGGSSDAAATLRALNQLWETHLTFDELERVAVKIGADVPFCIRGGMQHALGIGEKLSALENPEPISLILIQPCTGLSTKEVFNAYDRQTALNKKLGIDAHATAQALLSNDLPSAAGFMGNDLQSVACEMRPPIRSAIEDLLESGATCAQMTGSGTVVFGAFQDKTICDSAAFALKNRWASVFVTRTADAGQLTSTQY